MRWWAGSRPATGPLWLSTRRSASAKWAACRRSDASSIAGSTWSSSNAYWSVEPQHLAGIHPVVGIQGALDEAHRRDGRGVLLLQAGDLAEADAMLAGAGAAHGERAMDHAVIHALGTGHLLGIVGVDHEAEMEISVSHMADDDSEKLRLHHIALCLEDAFGKARDGHADIGRPSFRARTQGQPCVIGIMARLPEPVPVFGTGRPAEIAGTVIARDGLHGLRLLHHTLLAAVELEEERR